MIGINSKVLLTCGLKGQIVAYNNSTGMYHKDQYPYIVLREDGHKFEYAQSDIAKVIRYVGGDHKEEEVPCFAGAVINSINNHPRMLEEILGIAKVIVNN